MPPLQPHEVLPFIFQSNTKSYCMPILKVISLSHKHHFFHLNCNSFHSFHLTPNFSATS